MRSEERCTAVLFESVMVMNVHTLDTSKDLEKYEQFIKEATQIQQEGRRAGDKVFHIEGDFCMELVYYAQASSNVGWVAKLVHGVAQK